MYREGLLILSIVLIILGVGLGYVPFVPDPIPAILFWVGIILLVIWIVLFAIAQIRSGG